MHTAYGNETDPAIIPCWIKRLNSSQLPADHRHNPVLALLITYYERLELFTTMPQSVDGLYDITDFRYVNTSNTDYHIGFEYSVYIFDQSMDRSVAICGIRYYAEGTNKQCLATIFTLIRYNSSIVTTIEPPTTEITSTEVTTVSNATTATTEGCNQTPNETDTPSTTAPVPPLPPGTATSGPLGSIVTGLSLSMLILVVTVAILVLITVILWVKLRTVSADVRVQRATCTCAQNLHQSSIQMNKEIVSDSEGENNENRSSNLN